MRLRIVVALLFAGILAVHRVAASFVTFESGQVRPLTLSPDGRTLLALNTPDARLEVFGVDGGAITHHGSVPVGLEPVAVAARTNTEIWVVNHLSDPPATSGITLRVKPRTSSTRICVATNSRKDMWNRRPSGRRHF